MSLSLQHAAGATALALSLAAATAPADTPEPGARGAGSDAIEASSPTLSEGIFPCTGCHADMKKDGTRRVLSFHDEQLTAFSHNAGNRWCLDCHDLENRDVLRLVGGEHVPFGASHRLCGQCHGDKLRDWRTGVHGKRIGSWSGAKEYFACVQCHNPHAPGFRGTRTLVVDGKPVVAPSLEPVKPEPRPLRPEEMRK
jgi:hypothetical protein